MGDGCVMYGYGYELRTNDRYKASRYGHRISNIGIVMISVLLSVSVSVSVSE